MAENTELRVPTENMPTENITTVTLDQLVGQRIWIYAWNNQVNVSDNYTYFYALPGPIRVAFNFTDYGHITLITQNVSQMLWAIHTILQPCGFLVDIKDIQIGEEGEGYLIIRECSLADLEQRAYLGTPVFLYVRDGIQRYRLHTLLQYNYSFFGIRAMGPYRDTIYCYFDHERRRLNGCFFSRGIFQISDDCQLSFVNEDWHSFKALAFNFEICRLNSETNESDNVPTGDSINDRLVSVTCTEYAFMECTKLPSVIRTWSMVYYPGVAQTDDDRLVIIHPTESKMIAHVIEILRTPGPTFLTAFKAIDTFYPYLFKRAILYGLLPRSIPATVIAKCCIGADSSSLIHVLTPPWILTVDLTLYCRRFHNDNCNGASDGDNSNENNSNSNGNHKSEQDYPNKTDLAKLYIMLEDRPTPIQSDTLVMVLKRSRDKTTNIAMSSIMQNAIQVSFGLGQLVDANPEMCLRPESQTMITRHLLESQFQSTFTAPLDPLVGDTGDKGYGPDRKYAIRIDTRLKGGLVLPSMIGIHRLDNDHAIGSWDFRALYPSIMHGMNLQTGYVTCISKNIPVDRDKFHVLDDVDNGVRYVSTKDDLAPVGRLCDMLIKRRFHYKTAGYNSLARGLKYITNSIWGLMACRYTKYFDAVVAAMVTSYGRHLLGLARDYAVAEGCTVLAGDTDSLFLQIPTRLGASLDSLTRGFAEYFAKSYPKATLISLDLKARYELLVICCKKKYAGVLRTKEGCTTIQIVGLARQQYEVRNQTRNLVEAVMNTLMDHPINYRNQMYDLINNWFYNTISTMADIHFVNTLNAKPSHTYKNLSYISYIVSRQYEMYNECAIPKNGINIPYYYLVPLVPQKTVVCYVECYNPHLQTVDKTKAIFDNFSCVDRFLQVIDDRCSLKQIQDNYIQLERSRLILLHKEAGYLMYDLSYIKLPNLAMTFKNGRDIFRQEQMNSYWWDRMTKKEKLDGGAHHHLILRAVLHYNTVSHQMWITLPAFQSRDGQTNTTPFYMLRDVEILFPPFIRNWIQIVFDCHSSHKVNVNDFQQMRAFIHLLYSLLPNKCISSIPPTLSVDMWTILLPHLILQKNHISFEIM